MPYNSTTHAVEARLPLHVVNCLIALLNTHARVGSPVERTFLPTSCVYGITITRHSDGSRVAFSALWGICHAAIAAGHSGAPLHRRWCARGRPLCQWQILRTARLSASERAMHASDGDLHAPALQSMSTAGCTVRSTQPCLRSSSHRQTRHSSALAQRV